MKRYCTDNGIFFAAGFTELIVSSIAFPRSAALLYKEFYNIVKHRIVVGWLNWQLIACKGRSVRLCVNLAGKASGCVYGDVTTMRFQLCLDDLRGKLAGIVYSHTAHIHLLRSRFVRRTAEMQGCKQTVQFLLCRRIGKLHLRLHLLQVSSVLQKSDQELELLIVKPIKRAKVECVSQLHAAVRTLQRGNLQRPMTGHFEIGRFM